MILAPDERRQTANTTDTNKRPFRAGASRAIAQVAVLWHRAKVSKLSKYSIDRAEALDKYSERTSLLNVLVLCALLPWPSLLLELLVECIPVNDPKCGSKGNIGACFRVTIIVFSVAVGTLFQVRATAPGVAQKIIVLGINALPKPRESTYPPTELLGKLPGVPSLAEYRGFDVRPTGSQFLERQLEVEPAAPVD
ncbi:hypothetical protein ON010_g17426 [Phytophthora cinnamomi]|nr:hypothetical protein ON010_g17426 [Phytophthora cinnamomi]